jgi:hypothetical protein
LPLDGYHAPRDRTCTAWRDQLQKQIIVQSDLVPIRADKCPRMHSDCQPVVP